MPTGHKWQQDVWLSAKIAAMAGFMAFSMIKYAPSSRYDGLLAVDHNYLPHVIVALLILVAYIVFRSKARFFIAGASIVGAEVSNVMFDFSGIIARGGFAGQTDKDTKVESAGVVGAWFGSGPAWPVHVVLILLAGFLFWLDHQRRPGSISQPSSNQ